MLDAFLAVMGGDRLALRVRDPLGSPITASYGATREGVALIESAQAVGLHLVPPDRRNPLVASSYGVGEMITDAYRRGSTIHRGTGRYRHMRRWCGHASGAG